MRGNLLPRLARLDAGEGDKPLDALVVSYAGLCRVSQADRATQLIPALVLAPATGAGMLVVEQRSGDTIAAHLLDAINDPATARLLAVERGVLAQLERQLPDRLLSPRALHRQTPPDQSRRRRLPPFRLRRDHVAATGPAEDLGGLVENITQLLHGEGVERLMPR